MNFFAYVSGLPTGHVDASGLQVPQRVADEAYDVIAALCDCECLECPQETCLREAKTIANAYVTMWYREKTWRFRLPGPWNDYRSGWVCYQWQTHTFNEIEPVVSEGECFDIRRVGQWRNGTRCVYVGAYEWEQEDYLAIVHNWVAISAKRSTTARDAVPRGGCTIYLDPWENDGPIAFPSDDHRAHNCVMVFSNGPDEAPTGARYLCRDGDEYFYHDIIDKWTW